MLTARTVTLLRQPAQREGLGGAGKSPNSFSMASSSDRMVESYPGGPTTWRLVGVPDEDNPMGKLPAASSMHESVRHMGHK